MMMLLSMYSWPQNSTLVTEKLQQSTVMTLG